VRILLVNPLWTLENIVGLSLPELAACVRQEGFEDIRILDMNHDLFLCPLPLYLPRAMEIIQDENPDIIGIHCNNVHVPWVVMLCREIKKTMDVPVVLGGNHPTFRPEEMLNLSGSDFVVRAEGEVTFTELLKALKNGAPLSSIDGLSYRINGEIHHNPDRPVIKDLSILPPIAFDLIDRYLVSSCQRPQQSIEITASRGCPYRCIFCSARLMWPHQRRKPVDRVIGEIRHLKERYNIPEISIGDECLTVHKAWLSELLEGIKDIGIQWNCSTRIDQVNLDVIRQMAESGCISVLHGLESGSERMRNFISKNYPHGMDNGDILELIRLELSHGIKPVCSFITGIPEETKKDMEETIEFAIQLSRLGCEMQYWIMTPYFGSPARDRHADRIFCMRRWKLFGQWDIFKPLQFVIYHDYFEEFNEENPDLLMYLPDIKLDEFIRLYTEGRKRIGLKDTFPPGSHVYHYILERGGGKYFFDFVREVPLKDLDSAEPGDTLYLVVHLMRDNIEAIYEKVVQARPAKCLLSLRLEKSEVCREAGARAESFLERLEKENVKFQVLRALPEEIFGDRAESVMQQYEIPKYCSKCLEIFSITPKERIKFCYGRVTFRLEYAANRKQMTRLFELLKEELEPHSYRCACFADPDSWSDRQTPLQTA